jgi:hypothetical protein
MQAMRHETNLAMHCHTLSSRKTVARNVVTGHTLDKVSWSGVAKWPHDARIDGRMGENVGCGGRGLIKVWRLEHEAGGDAGTNHHAAPSNVLDHHGITVLQKGHIVVVQP